MSIDSNPRLQETAAPHRAVVRVSPRKAAFARHLSASDQSFTLEKPT
jgi:hypothetical protein